MTFGVPELIQTILKKEDCEVEMEPLDVNFADKLITHLYVPEKDLDIDIHSLEGERIKIEVWDTDPFASIAAFPYSITDIVFDMNAPNFVESLTELLLKHLHGSLVKIRFQRRKDVNNDKKEDPKKEIEESSQ